MKLCLTVLGLRYLTYQGSNFRRQGLRPARPCLAGDAELGFDLLFEPLTGLQGGKTADLRLLVAILLYPEGEEKHKEFKDLPYKMDFHLKRDEILRFSNLYRKMDEFYGRELEGKRKNSGEQ